jgi:energy-converting hydrogenase Eha subunit A
MAIAPPPRRPAGVVPPLALTAQHRAVLALRYDAAGVPRCTRQQAAARLGYSPSRVIPTPALAFGYAAMRGHQ